MLLRDCVRRSGMLPYHAACCLLCVRRSNGVVQAPLVLPGRVHACMKPMFDFCLSVIYIFNSYNFNK